MHLLFVICTDEVMKMLYFTADKQLAYFHGVMKTKTNLHHHIKKKLSIVALHI